MLLDSCCSKGVSLSHEFGVVNVGWNAVPEARPSFKAIKERLETMYQGSSIEEEVRRVRTFRWAPARLGLLRAWLR
jgi:hypothetical protein